MDLELRDTALSDLEYLMPLISPFQCDVSQRGALRAMLSEIVLSKSGIAAVAVDSEQSNAIIHFFFGVCVTDESADEYHECRHPLLARRVLAQWVAGKNPFLRADEIARANAGSGLNFVVPYYGGRPDDPRASIANYESARRAMRGWKLRTYTSEIFADSARDNREWGRSLGYRVLEYLPSDLRAAGVPQDWEPFIWAATRRDAELSPGYATALLFSTYAPPRFAFTPREQHVLSLAFDGATDRAIARAAGISESAVKKHFRTLYEKVHAAGAFEPLVAGAMPAESTRGVELRRHLLTYLREHPEELRPYNPPRRSRAPTPHR
jgi:DNA-binding CsgD family transcriptional regulator